MSGESIKPHATSDNSLASSQHISFRTRIKFDAEGLKQDKVTFNHKIVVNTYIVSQINLWSSKQIASFTLGNILFGAVKLTKNANFDKFKYLGHGIRFDARRTFSLSDGSGFDKNVITLGAVMSSSGHVDNGKKRYLDSW